MENFQNKTQRKELSSDERSEIAGAFKCGVRQIVIAEKLGFPISTVYDTIKRLKETGSPHPSTRIGPMTNFSERDERTLITVVKNNRHEPLDAISHQFKDITGKSICKNTARKILSKHEIHSYYITKKPLLTPLNAAIRMNWCNYHKNMDLRDWKLVTFSDESRFALFNPDGGERLWRKPSEKYDKDCIGPTLQMGGGSVMFWGVISFWGVGPLVPVTNSMNSDEYVEVLAKHYVPWIQGLMVKRTSHGPPLKFQQDNCSIHKSGFSKWWMNTHNFDVMDWPSRSPDLNPIENLWDILDRRVRKRAVLPKNLKELETAVLEEWQDIPLTILHHLYESMDRRINGCLNSDGYHTKY